MTVPPAVPREHAAAWSELDLPLRWHERLHAFVVGEGAVFVLIDTNSDGREIELRIYVRAPDGAWVVALELDDVGDPGTTPVELPGYAYGRAQPSSSVTISYRDEMRSVPTDSLGWWAFFAISAFDADGSWDWATPQRVN